MISVEFKEGEKYAEVCGLVQWDYGQYLQISGISIDEREVEVHFSEGRHQALIAMADVIKSGTIKVRIPDILLKSGNEIKAYVYLADAESGKTVRIVNMPVKRRPKPDDYTDPKEKSLLRLLQEKIKGKADNLEVDGEYLQLISDGVPIGNRIRLPDIAGREIELKNNGEAICWRYTDSNEWYELIKLLDLRGKDGITPELEIRDGHLFAIYND